MRKRIRMARRLRRVSATAALVTIAACATSPRGPAGPPYSMHTLRLCPGVSIANAPPAAPDGALLSYSPLTVVRSSMLSRAPVAACLSSGFGPRAGRGGAGSVHEGIDLYTGTPRAVLAAGDGRIASIGESRGYGLTVVLDHGRGVLTRYAHLSSTAPGLSPGRRVFAGETIAMTGRSGNASAVHLHYEIVVDGRPVDPLAVED